MLHLVSGNDEDLREFYESHKGRLGVGFEVLRKILSTWDIWRLQDGKPIAVIVAKDGAAHIATYHGASVGIKRMRWALKALGIQKTTVSESFRPGHVLAMRLGFTLDHVENKVAHYVRIPY